MLKIRDNVDLKELKKYGIKKTKWINSKSNKTWYTYEKDDSVINSDRIINEDISIETLYDLIKADLVEKVKE